MISTSTQEIIKDIKNHVKRGGGEYNAWYVGISGDAYDTLFSKHGVKGSWFIYRQAGSPQAAREVRDYLVDTLGVDGSTGDADEEAEMVYAYKKAAYTVP